MGASLRQSRALALLLVRHFQRRALKAGAAPTQQRVPSFLILSIVWAGYIGGALWRMLDGAAHLGTHRLESIGWQLDGVVLMLIGFGMGELSPEIGRVRSPLRATLLDELPVTTTARVMLALFRNPFVIALPVLAMLGWAPSRRETAAGVAQLVLMGLCVYVAAMSLGYALATWVRVGFSARGRRAIGVGSFALGLAGFPLVSAGAALGGALSPGRLAVALASSVSGGTHPLLSVVALVAVAVIACAAITLGELRGYDRLDAAGSTTKRVTRGRLTLDRVERLLAMREGGTSLVIVETITVAGVMAAACFTFVRAPKAELAKQLSLGYALLVAYLGAIFALNQAGLAARRDAGVRALLSPLPLSPYETLDGKVRTIRRLLIPLFVSALPVIATALHHPHRFGWPLSTAIVWRSTASLAAVWLAADASVSIAFLTNGVGLPGTRSLGAPTSYAAQLLFLPLLAAAAAPDLVTAAAALVAVAAIRFEARRAARRCVRWLDDAADDVERETTVWRALLALAVFFAVQALGAQFLRLGSFSPATTLALIYAIAAVVLVVLTVQGRKQLGPLRVWPRRVVALPLGLVAGALSGAAAIAFGRLLVHLGVTGGELEATGAAARAWLFAALVVMAPLAEETFFRGWLQDAIAADLPRGHQRWAFVLAALAFAFAHVGSYVVPQLTLGLVAGALYVWSGGLLPGMLAHAAHNAIALFFGG